MCKYYIMQIEENIVYTDAVQWGECEEVVWYIGVP